MGSLPLLRVWVRIVEFKLPEVSNMSKGRFIWAGELSAFGLGCLGFGVKVQALHKVRIYDLELGFKP